MSRDPRVDDYIARQAAFAQPILGRLRDGVHAACPEVEEGIKWSMPAFSYRGRPLANMAAFKAHATFGFWHEEVMADDAPRRGAMGQFGRIASLDDLPDDVAFAALVKEAMALIDAGAKPRRTQTARAELPLPDDLAAAIAALPTAQATYDGFSPSARRDYHEWVLDAKRPETRARRVAQAATWMAEGKKRHWKYESC